MQYVVQMHYRSAGIGPYTPGQVIELTDAEAAWLGRDCPGVIAPLEPPAEAEERAPEAPPQDRMVRKASRRKP